MNRMCAGGLVCVKVQQGGGASLLCAVGGPACSCVCCAVKGVVLFLILGGNVFFAGLLYVHGGS